MSNLMSRKAFLKLMGVTAGGIALMPLIEPIKKIQGFVKPSGEPESESESESVQGRNEHEEIEYGVYLPNDRPFAISMEEWAHQYWKWYLSFSKENNIIKDSGHLIMTNQPANSPMFFIPSAGSYDEEYGPQLVRHLKVSHKQGLFFSVLTTIADLTDIPHIGDFYNRISDKPMPSAVYKNRSPEGMLHHLAKLDMDYTKSALVTLNGEGLPYYRIHSTKAFTIEYAVNNIPSYQAGSTLAVQDGLWVFLKPLKKGFYNILIKSEGTHVGMRNPEDSYRMDVLNHIEVV